MFRALASVLLLGLFPPVFATPENHQPLPNIELISVAGPSPVATLTAPSISASGAVLIDLQSGEKLFGIAEDTPRPMGSLTKLMTAIVFLENHSADERVKIPALPHIEGTTIPIQEGQEYVVRDLIKGLLIESANNVAYALAIIDSGSVDAFATKMNARAGQLGLAHTHFDNPAGLDSIGQYSSPRDLGWLAAAALRKPLIKQIVDMPSATLTASDGTQISVTNTNEFLKSRDNVFGMKTGTTPAAGQCLITLFAEGNRSYLLVILGSNNRYNDASRIMKALHSPLL